MTRVVAESPYSAYDCEYVGLAQQLVLDPAVTENYPVDRTR